MIISIIISFISPLIILIIFILKYILIRKKRKKEKKKKHVIEKISFIKNKKYTIINSIYLN